MMLTRLLCDNRIEDMNTRNIMPIRCEQPSDACPSVSARKSHLSEITRRKHPITRKLPTDVHALTPRSQPCYTTAMILQG